MIFFGAPLNYFYHVHEEIGSDAVYSRWIQTLQIKNLRFFGISDELQIVSVGFENVGKCPLVHMKLRELAETLGNLDKIEVGRYSSGISVATMLLKWAVEHIGLNWIDPTSGIYSAMDWIKLHGCSCSTSLHCTIWIFVRPKSCTISLRLHNRRRTKSTGTSETFDPNHVILPSMECKRNRCFQRQILSSILISFIMVRVTVSDVKK